MGDHKEFLKRITKSLYYGQLPTLPCLSLPVTEVSCAAWSGAQRGRSLRRLHCDAAAGVARAACAAPAALVLAMLYLERLRARSPHYLAATPPLELFLVSLMVGNKFLQDDGEDDEVICSEWAASGGLELKQLKKLEVEFLDAMDWNIFVNEESFETGLCWLERQVALKQAQLHGFFTYTDLAATSDAAQLGDFVRCVSAAWLAATLGYVTGLLTLVTSALVITQACMPAAHHFAATLSAPAALHTSTLTHTFHSGLTLTSYVPNSTTNLLPVEELVQDPAEEVTKVKCCASWLQHQATVPKKSWNDGEITHDWDLFQPWWSRTSVMNWLYQSSLINPMQRWLEKVDGYADWFKQTEEPSNRIEQCEEYVKHSAQQRCVRQWLNLSKLSALIVSVSDR